MMFVRSSSPRARSVSSMRPMPASTSASDFSVSSAPIPLACAVPSGSFSHMNVTSGCTSSSPTLR